jgi:hypothetical protein
VNWIDLSPLHGRQIYNETVFAGSMTGEAMPACANRSRQMVATSKFNGALNVFAGGASDSNCGVHINGVISHPPQTGIAAIIWQYYLAS